MSGYEDGSVRVFDLKTGQQIGSLTDGLAHTSPVASIAAHKDNTMTISGSLDGTAILYNTISGKVWKKAFISVEIKCTVVIL